MLSFLLVIPIVGVILYLALIFESIGFALLGFSAATFAVLSFISLLFMRKQAEVTLSIPMKVVDREQTFALTAEVENRAFLPVGKLWIKLAYGENQKIAREKIILKMRDLPRGKSSETKRLSIRNSGYYEFAVSRIRVYDVFGIFYLSHKGKSVARVMVLPKIEEVPVRIGEGVKHFYGETVDYDESRPGQDPSEVFGVREFHDGDKLQRIHWKLSARTDELMVKEDSLPKSCAIVLFFPEGAVSESKNLSYLASLSFTLMDTKVAHYVSWLSQSTGDVTRVRVDDEESFYLALTTYLQDGSAKSVEDRVERYREKYKGQAFLHAVSADAGGSVIVDGELVIRPENFRDELFLK